MFVTAVATARNLWHRGETKYERHSSAGPGGLTQTTEEEYTVEQPRPGSQHVSIGSAHTVDFLEINLSSTGQEDRVALYYHPGAGSTSTMDEVSLHL
jgi:hypothetical protein